MTVQEVRLCGLLLREHFGEVVEKVGTHLLKCGAQNLRTIIHETGLSVDLVRSTTPYLPRLVKLVEFIFIVFIYITLCSNSYGFMAIYLKILSSYIFIC